MSALHYEMGSDDRMETGRNTACIRRVFVSYQDRHRVGAVLLF